MASSSGCAPGEAGRSLPGAVARDDRGSPPEPAPDRAGETRTPSRGNQRFPRSRRLTSRGQFQAVYRGGVRVSAGPLTVFALRRDTGQSRLGLTVSRKIGGAVCRNRVKRRLREVFRVHLGRVPGGTDLVVNTHRGVHRRTHAELEDAFLACCRRLSRREPRR